MNTVFSQLPRGLYGITPDWEDFSRLYTAIEHACEAGLPILQWRRKTIHRDLSLEQASLVAQLCQKTGTCFIINDDWQLAIELGADGVHLGKDDQPFEALKQKDHPLIIGISCYNQLNLAQHAIEQGASYIAFGAVFDSSVKPLAAKASLDLFQNVDAFLPPNRPRINKVAIGGITQENAPLVIQAGADNIALISGLFEQDDVYQTCQSFIQLFHSLTHHDQ